MLHLTPILCDDTHGCRYGDGSSYYARDARAYCIAETKLWKAAARAKTPAAALGYTWRMWNDPRGFPVPPKPLPRPLPIPQSAAFRSDRTPGELRRYLARFAPLEHRDAA